MLAVLLLCACNADQLAPVRCHRAELNQIYRVDETTGAIEFGLRQWIFWDWDKYGQRFIVREWQLAPIGIARPMRSRGRWLIPYCGKTGGAFFVEPGTYERTWTTHDAELINRESFLPSMRIPLNRRGQ